MKIAIQAADLDADRIDGTRVYILNMLRFFGGLAPTDEFYLYHKKNFNPALVPPTFSNYKIVEKHFPFFFSPFHRPLSLSLFFFAPIASELNPALSRALLSFFPLLSALESEQAPPRDRGV